jgi:hypothetical protein
MEGHQTPTGKYVRMRADIFSADAVTDTRDNHHFSLQHLQS